jgi:limonene 1,2-monooxygenase
MASATPSPTAHLRFGLFMPPYHNPRRNPTGFIEQDLRHVEELDRLGYDEVWFGEHHSGGYETIPSPEIMIAAAAQCTRRIELCSGVISLPYHHPLMVADRIVFLDHLTRGRVRIGVGPGALVADSQMMGMDYNQLRPRMEESLDAILELLDSAEGVSRKTAWFTLDDARLQLQSFTRPRVRLSVASALSPSGPKLAGRYGLNLLSIGGTSEYSAQSLSAAWGVAQAEADKHGQTVDRSQWAVVGNMFVAESDAAALEATRFGLREFMDYRHVVTPMKMVAPGEVVSHEELVRRVNDSGYGCIGGPERATDYIQRVVDLTGGFGTFLLTAHDWADAAGMSRMFEIVADQVFPRFNGADEAPTRSYLWTKQRKEDFSNRFDAGIAKAKADYRSQDGGTSVH